MVDSTVIVQHVASVVIFCCCFVAIFQKRVSPLSVVSWASFCTFLAWLLWDYWMGQEETIAPHSTAVGTSAREESASSGPAEPSTGPQDLRLTPPQENTPLLAHSHNTSVTSIASNVSSTSRTGGFSVTPLSETPGNYPHYVDPTSSLSPRNQQRLATAKSALLIYAALLGLSPILKSLTKSTTSDSIWALSTWLLCMNVAFFDYGAGTGAQ